MKFMMLWEQNFCPRGQCGKTGFAVCSFVVHDVLAGFVMVVTMWGTAIVVFVHLRDRDDVMV